MSDLTTNEEAGKRMRAGAMNLTDRICRRQVARRIKLYDRKASGLYVSIIPAGVATFYFKFTDRSTGKQRSKWLGVHSEAFTVEHARTAVYALKTRIGNGENIAETLLRQKAQRARQGKTVNEIVKERIEWMKTPVRKADGEMRARIESWENVASHLRRFICPRLGKMIASDVTKHDIVTLSNNIVAGKFGKPSTANARHMRRAASALFNWAAEAGRDYVTASPCVNLPKLDKEHPRQRRLSPEEIRILWHGLDRDNLPWDRKTRLAIKFALATMLRSGELLAAHKSELFDLDGENPRFDVPLKRVKKRRVIQAPLSSLAVEIIKEALSDDGQQYVFATPLGGAPLHRMAMATALRGTKHKNGEVKTPGLCALLGMKPFTPHDLRRSSASLARALGFNTAWIAACLDHAVTKDEERIVPSVTTTVYALSESMKEKRAVLDGVAAELRRIIGEPVATELPLAA